MLISFEAWELTQPAEEPEAECTCTPAQEAAGEMNARCAFCRSEFEEWCEALEASGQLGPIESNDDVLFCTDVLILRTIAATWQGATQ